MKPKNLKKKRLRKNKYRLSWYKAMRTRLKNGRIAATEKAIALS